MQPQMRKRNTDTPPLRHHHMMMVVLAKAAAILCTIGAGFGVAIGLMAPQDGVLSGVVIPIVAGVVIAGALSIAWPPARIPTLIDPDGPGGTPLTLIQSWAILYYLAKRPAG